MGEYEQSWMPHHRDVLNYISPRRGHFRGDLPNRGDKRNGKILDGVAMRAKRVLQAGMTAGTVSPNWPWMKLTFGEEHGIPKFGPQKTWLSDVEQILYRIFQKSNFYRVMPTMFDEASTIGTAEMQIDEDPEKVIHCTQHTAGTYAIDTDERGNVDTLARRCWMSVGHLVKMFGKDNLRDETKRLWEEGELQKWIQVRHLIEPNDDRIEIPGPRGMPWRSLWWEKDAEDGQWLRQGGFEEFPIADLRWEVRGDSVYGTDCPGFIMLPDVRELQTLVKHKGEAIEKTVRPPLEVPASMEARPVDLTPAALNYVDTMGSSGSIRPILQINPQIHEMRQDIGELHEAIREAFYVNLFITLLQNHRSGPEKTATEISSIEGEKLLMLGPVLERTFHFLEFCIDRTFAIAHRQGLIPKPPMGLVGMDINVDFISTLAQAQRAVNAVSVERAVGFIGNIAGAWPEALDKIDPDALVETHWDMLGASPTPMRDDESLAALREQRQRAAQAQMAAESAKTAKDAGAGAKALSETDVSSDSALQRLLSGAAPGQVADAGPDGG